MAKVMTKAPSKKKVEGFSVSVTFVKERETKGAVRYNEVDDDDNVVEMTDPSCVVGTLYIRKSAIDGDIPERLTMTLASE